VPAPDQRLLSRIWNWLPAFREVARTQHLPTAAKRLHVTPSAASRSIRLLEEELEQPLFNRVGRRLVLNSAGERLLRAVDASSQSIDGALRGLASDPLEGPLRIASLGVLTGNYLVPALLNLRKAHEGLVPSIAIHSASEANDLLVRGAVDVAFYYDALTHAELVIESIGASTASVYCGKGHALFGRKRITPEELGEHAFSVPGIGDKGVSMDGWPVDVPRRIGMQITLLSTNVDVCASGQFVTVLPDVAAAGQVAAKKIWRLPVDVVPPVALFGARRVRDAEDGAAATVIAAVRDEVCRVDERLAALQSKPRTKRPR